MNLSHDLDGEPDFGVPAALDRDLTPDARVSERWANELARVNKNRGKVLALPAAADLIGDIVRVRGLPRMPWPGEWGALAERLAVFPGDLIALVGGPGSGKTQWAVQHARGFAAAGKGCVLWLPLELTPVDVGLRVAGNLTGRHVIEIREHWTQGQIAAALATVTDRWHFIDRMTTVDDQLAAIADAVDIAKRIYGAPPLVVVDYVQLLALLGGEQGERAQMAQACEGLRILTERLECYTLALSQTSRGNTPALAGHVNFESATDAMGMGAESAQIERAAAHQIVLAVFKADDAQVLDAHQLVNKVRHGGREGKVGARYHKAGGVWEELDYLPATPVETQAEVKRAKRRKGEPGEQVDAPQARAQLNAGRADSAAATRRAAIVDALRKAGPDGMGGAAIRALPKTGSPTRCRATLDELERGKRIRHESGRWIFVV